MAAPIGKLPEFNPDGGNFEVFLERFETYAAVNGIADDKKRDIFLTTIPDDVYATLRSLLYPKTPRQASFQESSSALKNHYFPRSSVVSERYRFNQRKQEPNESIADFIAAINEIAAQCEFGGFLQNALRDRLIAGLRTEAIRRRLLAMPDDEATWEQVRRIATEMEAAGKDDAKDFPSHSVGARPSTSAANMPRQLPGTTLTPETPRSPEPKVPKTVLKETKQTPQHSGGRQQRASFPASIRGTVEKFTIEKRRSQAQKRSGTPDEMGFACDHCNATYKHESSLMAHVMSAHTTDGGNPFTCQICHQMCGNLERLSAHIRTHTGERPFECPECDKSFGHQNTLRNHMLAYHLDSFDFVCQTCNKGYKTDKALEKHYQAAHSA